MGIDGEDMEGLHGDIIQVEGDESWKAYSVGGRDGDDDELGQVVVVEEQADLDTYVIPVSGGTVEIVQAGTAQDGTVTLQGVTMLPETGADGPVTLTEHEAIALTSGGQIFVTEAVENLEDTTNSNFVTTSHSETVYKGEITSI